MEPSAEIGSKDFLGNCTGKLLVELSELSSLQKSSPEVIKRVCSTQVDKYRRPYGTEDVERARRFVMVGTTNSDSYLTDETGARRFLPLRVRGITRHKAIERDRLQLWAEAYACYLEAPGRTCSIVPPQLLAPLRAIQKQRSGAAFNVEEEIIFEFLRSLRGGANVKNGECTVTSRELLKGMYPEKDESDRRLLTRTGKIARYVGGESRTVRRNGIPCAGWVFNLDKLGLLDHDAPDIEPAPVPMTGQQTLKLEGK